ncbi:S-layer homology domain-containing protein [Caloranaerobacter azorensis DSM 13643]|uniref:S-layer homology domain-containing protein n=1 Tax=Caloranaerobacter azorensis DSM 13643 TaxID=1121264 RepID=A0A1M5SKI0_9FIRM|nr:S-layer homology domain-containing protein [Caloranaerobacter azorensis]SHH39107.1 S-layer homology domain-containing protein [Caloranaerobacter azorensis DSM 13643]
MKKILSLVLVLSLVLGTFSFALAATPSDVEGTKYEDAVARLTALGVLNGYPDGTFRPNNSITRAEFTAAVIRTLNLKAAADAAKGATQFTDVPADHWASGYINIASKLGYVNGMGDGTFAPNAPVTYEQAVTLIMRALGYKPAAEDRGGYPLGYLALADEKDVTDGVDGVIGLAAPRGIVAQLLDNSLDVKMMVQTGYGDLKQYEESDKTLLDKLGLSTVEAQVVSVDTDKKEIVVNEKKDGAYTEKEEYKVLDGIKLAGLENAIVKLWVKSGKVLDITVKSTVKYDYIAKINGDTKDVEVEKLEDIKLLNEGKTYDIALNDKDKVIAKVYKDGSKLDDDEKLTSGLFAKIVLNGDEIVTIEAYDPQEAGLIKDVKDSKLVYTKGNRTKTIRDLDDAKKMTVVINGEAAEYKDLEEGMYFDYKEYASDKYIIVATDKKVEGEFDRIDSDDKQVRIDGDYIDVASNIYMSTDEGEHYSSTDLEGLDKLFDKDVEALLNNKGDVVYIAADVEEDTTTFYGFVVAKGDKLDERVKVEKIVDDKIKEVTYKVSIPSNDDSSEKFDGLKEYNEEADDKQTSKLNAFYKFTINEDEEIVKAEKVSSLSDYTAKEFSSKYDYIKVAEAANKVYVDNAVMFQVKDDGTVEYVKWEDIEKTAGNDLGIKFKADKVKANVVLITDSNNVSLGETKEYKVAFVLDRDKIASSGYKYEYEIATPDGTETYKAKEQKDENTVVVYELLSDDQIKIVADAVYDNMSSITVAGFSVVDGTVDEDSVSGSYFDINDVTYKVADDALVYRVEINKDGKAEFEEADFSDVDDEGDNRDTLYCLMEDGVVKVLFFKR